MSIKHIKEDILISYRFNFQGTGMYKYLFIWQIIIIFLSFFTLYFFQDPTTRHLSCPAAFTVGHLKKFIHLKFSLPSTYAVSVFCCVFSFSVHIREFLLRQSMTPSYITPVYQRLMFYQILTNILNDIECHMSQFYSLTHGICTHSYFYTWEFFFSSKCK